MRKNTDIRKSEIDKKLLDFIDGESMSLHEENTIKKWIRNKRQNKRYFNFVAYLSKERKYTKEFQSFDMQNQLNRLGNNLDRIDNKYQSSNSSKKIVKLTPLRQIAAALIILIAGIFTILIISNQAKRHVKTIHSEMMSEVILPDGSIINLNKDATLTYNTKTFVAQRELTLTGEAFFNVEKSEQSAFIVHSATTQIKVLGTKFNVHQHSNGMVKVDVLSGSVLFSGQDEQTISVVLEGGENAIFYADSQLIKKDSTRSHNFLFWKTGKLSFEDETLENVIQVLERAYAIKIEVGDADILEYKFTSVCHNQTVDEILAEMSIIFNIKVEKQGETYFLMKK